MKMIDDRISEISSSSSLAYSAWWVAGWERAYKVYDGYRRYGQHAYERLYSRLLKARKRKQMIEHNMGINSDF